MQKRGCSNLKLDMKCTLGRLLLNPCQSTPFSTPETPLSAVSQKSFWQNDSPSPTNHEQSPVYNFENFVEVKLVNDPSCLESEFEKLKHLDCHLSRSKGLFCHARKFPKKNRFSSILANEPSRVKLSRDADVYINANHIDGANFNVPQNYIACQAPLPCYHSEFWEMIHEQKTRVIVMLANEINEICSINESDCDPFSTLEKSRKVDQYWPNENGKLTFGSITVESKSVSMLQKDMIILREFLLHREGYHSHPVYLMQFFGWPDMSVPSVDPFMSLISNIDYLSGGVDSGPIVLHCVAGVGRTGTLAAIHIALTQLTNFMRNRTDCNPYFPFNIFNIVQELKKARVGMVQELDQYKFIYTTVLEGCRRLKYRFPKSVDMDDVMLCGDSNSSSLNSMDCDYTSNQDLESCHPSLSHETPDFHSMMYMSSQDRSNHSMFGEY